MSSSQSQETEFQAITAMLFSKWHQFQKQPSLGGVLPRCQVSNQSAEVSELDSGKQNAEGQMA